MSRRHKLRHRLAGWLDPSRSAPDPAADKTQELPLVPAKAPGDDVWIRVAQQFALRVLAASNRMSADLGEAEAAEHDPDRLHRLYRLDHVNTGVRRQAENLQVLAGTRVQDAGRQVTTLLDVARAAAAATDDYPRIRLGGMTGLAVVEPAADDLIRILTELFDNATRFSPPTATVTVAAHITEVGHVLVRIEDDGPGVDPGVLPRLNAALAGERPLTFDPENPAARVGLLVVQRLALAWGLRVSLVPRLPSGTTTTVLVPATLLCEAPLEPAAPGPAEFGLTESGLAEFGLAGSGLTESGLTASELAELESASVPAPADGVTLVDSGPSTVVRPVVPRSGIALPADLPVRQPSRVPPPFHRPSSARPAAPGPEVSSHQGGGRERGALPSRSPTRPRGAVPAPAPVRAVRTASTFSDEVGAFADGVAHAKADAAATTGAAVGGAAADQKLLETEGSGQ